MIRACLCIRFKRTLISKSINTFPFAFNLRWTAGLRIHVAAKLEEKSNMH